VYAAGAYLPVWRAAAVLVLWMCAEAIGLLQQGGPADDAAFAAAILCTAWAPGVVVRRLRMSERAARDAADQARQRERAGADGAITRERERIARELHDVVAHAVTLMVVQAAVAEELLDRDPATARQALASVQHIGRSAVTELARMLHLLREPEVAAAPLPSLATLPDLIAGAGQAGLQVELVEHGAAADAQVPAALQICAYRVVQEAITNAARHSRNPHVRVVVSRSPDSVEIEVEDDGGAGPRGEPGTGHGLIGLRERVAVFGGTLQAGSRDGSGYRVVARLPVAGAIPA
jgi:signal transduction histidine kinase